jgi:hypothetical protein
MKNFPATVPRKMFWSNEVGGRSNCPECGSTLANEHHTYVMAIREHGDMQPFIVGNDGGYFCARCPTVVLEHDSFRELALASLGHEGLAQFVVLGLVDLEAVPKEKSALPLGTDDNPIPLVRFTNLGQRGATARSQAKRRGQRWRSRWKHK